MSYCVFLCFFSGYAEIVKMLGSVPSDLLLVFKTNDCLRHIDMKLGAPLTSTVVVAETVAMVSLEEDLRTAWRDSCNMASFLRTVIVALTAWSRMMMSVSLLRLSSYWANQGTR